ncbi:serine/threonine-protein phosphatase 7 long form-like protein [Cucumis melo var. makuwa]|uniref:Serine/threonine-protein phosphatase 7 long form-like protein n=1 Tax=Cucumis melo var. makuwa TaxID=1194695 RepID=A0A5A7SG99_CUCMM|nr:serine/threonine-protein phosphatase 7 long form-like protein [Cucumis melo var. makuwa]
MPCRECTIMLQDVAVQLGLPVDGEPLTGSLRELCRASHAQTLEIAGPLMLLQVWAYDRFPIVAPQRML